MPARSRWRLKAGLSCGGLCGLGVSGPLFSGGAGRPSVWRLERLDRVSLQSRSLFNLCLHLVTYSFNCFLGVGITYGRSQCMPRAASSKRKRDCRDES